MTSAIAALAGVTMMNVYWPQGRRNHLIFVQPGKDSDDDYWKLPDGTLKTITVRFVDGKAKVERRMGEFLLEQKLAQRTPSSIIVPNRHVQMPEVRERHPMRILKSDPVTV